jgi:hypothetical protein
MAPGGPVRHAQPEPGRLNHEVIRHFEWIKNSPQRQTVHRLHRLTQMKFNHGDTETTAPWKRILLKNSLLNPWLNKSVLICVICGQLIRRGKPVTENSDEPGK